MELTTLSAASLSFAAAILSGGGIGYEKYLKWKAADEVVISEAKTWFIRYAGYTSFIADRLQAQQFVQLHDHDAADARMASSVFNGLAAITSAGATYTAAGTVCCTGYSSARW